MDVATRPLSPEDVDIVQWVLHTAISWSGDPAIPPLEVAVRHPELERYHRAWGRPGDFGVVGEAGGQFAGAAFARLFTEADHGYGFVDESTPELAIAVTADRRGSGIGRLLMEELASAARSLGVDKLSLSVNNPNPAMHLYASLGYETVRVDGDSSLMVLGL